MLSNRKRSWKAKGMVCKECGLDLTAHRECREVVLRCPSCGAVYDLSKYSTEMDDDFEEEMGFVPMDRI